MLDKDTTQKIRDALEKRAGIFFQDDRLWILEKKLRAICTQHKTTFQDIDHALQHRPYSSFVQKIYEEVTTHHTYFFREPEILAEFEKTVLSSLPRSQPIRFWSAATSTGEEAYTIAMLLHKNMYESHKTRILGTDISERSIEKAKLGVYDDSKVHMMPKEVKVNSFEPGKQKNYVSSHIRSFCSFQPFNLIESNWAILGTFNVIFMRNVLYYLSERRQKEVLEKAWEQTIPGGWLITSISESLRYLNTSWQQKSACIYRKPIQPPNKPTKKILLFTDHLSKEIISLPPLLRNKVDLQINPSSLNKRASISFRSIITHERLLFHNEYKQFWKRVAVRNIPCIVYKEKNEPVTPPIGVPISEEVDKSTPLENILENRTPVPISFSVLLEQKKSIVQPTSLLYALGASTGGVSALMNIIPIFPDDAPPIVITIHMPKDFTNSFADQLNSITNLDVQEAQHGEKLSNGMIRIAPGSNGHLTVIQQKCSLITAITRGHEEDGHVPSIDVLFKSLAKLNVPVVATLMTGMGRDGADGLWEIKRSGGYTLAQDEESSIIYGMPRVAWEQNAAYRRVSLLDIPESMKLGEEQAREKFERKHEK